MSFFFRTAAAGLLLLASATAASAHDYKAGDLVIQHPWSRAAPQGAKVAGGYFVVQNSGSSPDRLVAISSEIAGRAEIHEMAVDDKGVMTMRPVNGALEIPAGGVLELKPGSFHVMFMDLNERPEQDERFAGTLTFEKAGDVAVEFKVEGMGGVNHEHHGSETKAD